MKVEDRAVGIDNQLRFCIIFFHNLYFFIVTIPVLPLDATADIKSCFFRLFFLERLRIIKVNNRANRLTV